MPPSCTAVPSAAGLALSTVLPLESFTVVVSEGARAVTVSGSHGAVAPRFTGVAFEGLPP